MILYAISRLTAQEFRAIESTIKLYESPKIESLAQKLTNIKTFLKLLSILPKVLRKITFYFKLTNV